MRTPGNWIAHGPQVVSEHGVLIATAGTREHESVDARLMEREENARIMAASPELADLCEAIVMSAPFKDIARKALEAYRKLHGGLQPPASHL